MSMAPAAKIPKEAMPAHPMLVAMVVSLAAFMEVLDTTITNVSLSHIAGSLAASQDESTWVLTSYLVANGIVLPLSGWLAGVMGRKNFFMMCIGGLYGRVFCLWNCHVPTDADHLPPAARIGRRRVAAHAAGNCDGQFSA